ncbi:MAG: SRPBCC family protein [Planctomycetes bacterium]|nr:SRPBCC family protein [Planctomycetota bacterium]
MKEFTIEREQKVARPIAEVFHFFSDPKNLGEITPPFLDFHIVACSTSTIGEGTLIDYKLRLRGFPLRWRSRIRAWEPPTRFIDEQLSGPYRSWIHEHSFEDLGSATLVRDRVRYSVLGGALVNRLLVRPDVEKIFDYRSQRLNELFGSAAVSASPGAQALELQAKRAGLPIGDHQAER